MANTLYEYYKGLGKALPSLQERSKLYEQYGLGSAATYGGTAEQNTVLLSKLGGQEPSTPSRPFPTIGGQTGPWNPSVLAGTATPKPVEPKPYVSETTTGQSTLKALSDAGFATDELSLKKMYRDYGLEGAYGTFVGSNTQYNALRQTAIENTKAKLSAYQTAETQAKEAGYTQNQEIQTDESGNILPASPSSGGEVNSTYEYAKMSGDDYNKVMDSILESVGTTDLTKLISDFSGGELTTPEMELSKEDKQAQMDSLKTAASQGLSKLQQGLASKGMTFSGIRTESEANLAAETLSKESGINREFAGRIIGAARQEQTRRETALKMAETNYNKALEAQGYIYNPFTNTIEQTLESKKFALDVYKAGQVEKPQTTSIGGNLYQYNPSTGNWDLTIEAPAKAYEPPTSYQEWQLAGKPGTYASYLEGKNVTKGDKNALAFDTIATKATQELTNIASSPHGDEYTDPDVFIKYRNMIKDATPTYLDDFDKRFAGLLNPVDAKKLGIVQPELDLVEEIMLRATGVKKSK